LHQQIVHFVSTARELVKRNNEVYKYYIDDLHLSSFLEMNLGGIWPTMSVIFAYFFAWSVHTLKSLKGGSQLVLYH
jgi:hypothetical protein